VLVGPSGAGKTVLLEAVAGLLPLRAGTVLWDGQDITRRPPEARRFAMVYQDYALFPHMTAGANIAYGPRCMGLARAEARRLAAETARRAEIDHLLGRRVVTLSGGEQQRVAIARALAAHPRLLLLDEPLAAVDPASRHRLRLMLKRLHDETATAFLHVTHDVDEAMMLADRVGVMLDGSLRQVGPAEELFRRPTDPDVAEFLGLRNVFRGAADGAAACRCGPLRLHAAGATPQMRYVWVLPEEIILSRTAFESSARNQFAARVMDWQRRQTLVAVRLAVPAAPSEGEPLELTALITYASFEQLGMRPGADLYVAFKSSAVHCF